MKKALIIIGSIVGLFLIVIILGPLLFKSRIAGVVKNQANRKINATLNFDDVNVSLLKHFPELTLAVENLSIVNKEPFAGDTLLHMKEFQATVNLKSLIFGKQIQLVSIQLMKPDINLIVDKKGRANWDIVPVDTSKIAKDTTTAAFNMAIQSYDIRDLNLSFVNDSTNMIALVEGLNHQGSGDFEQTVFTLMTRTNIKSLSLKMDGVPYLSNAELDVKADFKIDTQNMKFTFEENQIRLNQLYLNFDGWVQLANDKDIVMDITFNTPTADFKNILSMIPFIYKQDFGELTAEGTLALSGKIDGTYNQYRVPKFDIKLAVNNGMFKYPDLPTPMENVSVDLNVTNPGGSLDETIVDLKKLHLEVLTEPIDFKLLVKTPVSDPYIDAQFNGVVNLADVKNLVPMENVTELAGMIQSDFRFRGNMSDIEKQRTSKLIASGDIGATNVVYAATDLPEKIEIKSAGLKVSPQNASLSNLNIKMGKSDLSANGGLDNIVGYVLSDQTLKGLLNIQSNYFDLTPWVTQPDTSALVAIELPGRVEFSMNANFKEVILENIHLTNAQGKLLLKNRVLSLIDLRSNLLQGSMVANGDYSYTPPQKPKINFDLNVTSFSIPDMYGTFVTVQKVAPLTQYLRGNFSGKMKLSSDLGDSLMPDLSTIYSKGSLDIPTAGVENLKALNQAASMLKIQALQNPTISNFKPSYTVEKGRLWMNETAYRLGNYTAKTSGSTGFDKTIDMTASIDIPTTELAALVGQNLSMLEGQITTVPIKITNTVDNPKVEIPFNDISKTIGDQVKAAAMKVAEDKKDELQQKAKDELEKKKKEAADKLKGLFGK